VVYCAKERVLELASINSTAAPNHAVQKAGIRMEHFLVFGTSP